VARDGQDDRARAPAPIPTPAPLPAAEPLASAVRAPWPLALLDVPALRRAGAQAVPFRQFVLKVHSRCNLNCSYCYIYNAADTSWRGLPPVMPAAVRRRAAERIAEHVTAHRLAMIRVDLHGGEPLLTGAEPLTDIAAAVRAAVPASCRVHFSVQTNGTLLTPDVLDRLAAHRIRVGLSLDGAGAALNRRRVDHAGRDSWPRVLTAALLLAGRPESYAGILATIDVRADPVAVYTSLLELRPPSVDLLLPHANWGSPPPPGAGPTPYGDWLVSVFDQWWSAPRPGPSVRLFRETIGLLLGMPSAIETVGLSPMGAVVIETDGSVEQVDSLKTAYEGAARTGLDLFRHRLDQALDHPGFAARQLGLAGLGARCRRCSLVAVCGGGNYAHRFRDGSGFLHSSVYCADLERFIRHVARRLDEALPPGQEATMTPRQPI
jgi:uncharacterized protein